MMFDCCQELLNTFWGMLLQGYTADQWPATAAAAEAALIHCAFANWLVQCLLQ